MTEASPRRDPDRPLRALAWMVGSSLMFSVMSVFVKRLAPVVPHFELVFFRSFVNFVLVAALMRAGKESFRAPNRRLLIFRGVMGFGGVSCLFYTVMHLPLSIAALLNWCSPLFVILFSTLFLKERPPKTILLWVAVAFAGLVLLIRPDFGAGTLRLPLGAVGIGILGAAFAGMAYVAVRAATARVGVNLIILYFTGTSTLLSAPLALAEFRIPNGGIAAELLLVGIFASIAQYAMTQAYRFAMASLVSTMSLLTAVFGAIFGWTLFGEVLEAAQWAGMVLLGSAVALASLTKPSDKPRQIAV